MMAEPWAKALYNKRKQTVEPVFGIIKEHMGGRRFLLRGLANVRAEWSLIAAAFNLRTLLQEMGQDAACTGQVSRINVNRQQHSANPHMPKPQTLPHRINEKGS